MGGGIYHLCSCRLGRIFGAGRRGTGCGASCRRRKSLRSWPCTRTGGYVGWNAAAATATAITTTTTARVNTCDAQHEIFPAGNLYLEESGAAVAGEYSVVFAGGVIL